MKMFLLTAFKLVLKAIYAPMKLFKTKNRIVYLSRQSNSKSLDMQLLEQAINSEDSSVEQVFRLKMIDDGIVDRYYELMIPLDGYGDKCVWISTSYDTTDSEMSEATRNGLERLLNGMKIPHSDQ